MTNQEINNDANVIEKIPNSQKVEQPQKKERTDSYFDGSVLGLIGWRILAFLITSVTLGIGAPWAKCLLYSYQFKHTVYNGKRLRFKGTGGSLLLNIIKWFFFSIITLGIYTLVIPVKRTKWVISNLYFEGEECKNGESYFDGNTLQLIGVNLLSGLLTLISFGLLYPFTVCYKLRWINKHTVINRKRLAFEGSAISLWGHYILWYLLLIVTLGIFGFWLPIKQLKWQTKNTRIRAEGETQKKDLTLLIAIPILLLAVAIGGYTISSIVDSVDFSKVDWNRVEIREFIEDVTKGNVHKIEFKKNDGNAIAQNEDNSKVYVPNNNKADADGYTTYVDPSVDYTKYRQPYVSSAGGVEDVLANTDIVCAPATQEIPGEYIVDIRDGSYNTIQSEVTVTFSSNGTNLKYNNNDTVINYDPSSGYAYSAHDGETETYDAYFTVLSNGKIKVEMNISKGDSFTNIIGYRK